MHLGAGTATRVHLETPNPEFENPYIDPLDPDSDEDRPVIVTRRQLIRLATVSTEVGARFQRDSVDHDSMAWMLAPRILFSGRDAIEASLEQQHCIRALVLHGLGLGLDALPGEIDDLMNDRTAASRGSPCRATRPKRGAELRARSRRRGGSDT